MSETERIIVSGGAGFLGSHLCESLIQEGNTVFCVDNLGSGTRENIEHLTHDPNFWLVEADIREALGLPAADKVFHLASRASPADFTEFPVQIALTNTEGTRHLLDYAVKHDARMVYASTSEVYGDPEVHPQPESYTGNVNIRGPRGCYDEAKRFGETLTVAYQKRYNVDVRTGRIFNTYGPRMRPDDGRVVPTFVSQALSGEDLTIYGDGTQTRSFCYVDDMVTGLRALMDGEGLGGEVFNLGRRNEITIKTLAKKILELTRSESELTYEPLPKDDPSRRQPDITRALERLDWEPSVPLEKGLRRTIKHYSE
jgi:UDP-glucuronate decarboxylase